MNINNHYIAKESEEFFLSIAAILRRLILFQNKLRISSWHMTDIYEDGLHGQASK